MATDLTTLPFRELLGKFGSGGHKPGSGSAAAQHGLLSCALSKTVISLTLEKPEYAGAHENLRQIGQTISESIEPALWDAFTEDSVQFDKVIDLRRRRDAERDPAERWRLAREALDELRTSCEIPLRIAELCLDLGGHALTVFDDGFKHARGDSEVAIDSALSGATGSVSIVYLNLQSYRGDSAARDILRRAEDLEERARLLNTKLQTRIAELKSKAQAVNTEFGLDIGVLRDRRRTGSPYSNAEIEAIARNLQNEIWRNRAEVWPHPDTVNGLDVLNVQTAFELLGYRFETAVSLGAITEDASGHEVAGYVNKAERYAAVSARFPPTVQNFTGAHELGHALLHGANEQFRDRGLDGSVVKGHRSQVEFEADKFAAYFLMPERLVRAAFRGTFGVDRFVASDASAFALGAGNVAQLLRESPTVRALSLRLARIAMVGGAGVTPLADRFRVSYEAMAIRIEELGLIGLAEGQRRPADR